MVYALCVLPSAIGVILSRSFWQYLQWCAWSVQQRAQWQQYWYVCIYKLFVNYTIDCNYSRFLQLPSIPLNENAIELLGHSVTFYSDDYVRALNGEIEDGRLSCNLSTSEPFMANRTYSLPDDIISCSQVCCLMYQSMWYIFVVLIGKWWLYCWQSVKHI